MNDKRLTLEEQFERILQDHGAAISRLALSYEPVVSLREELMQEIALAIWRALSHFRGECSERTFIFRIAHNRGLTHVCRRTLATRPLDELEESQEPPDPRPDPAGQVQQMHQRAQLMRAIQSLSLAHRQIIVLMLEGLSHAGEKSVPGRAFSVSHPLSGAEKSGGEELRTTVW
jgi:RNA polymerase sigma factor (sigma-70 family)